LALLITQLVRHQALAAFTTIVPTAITHHGLLPALGLRRQMPISLQALTRPAPAACASLISSIALSR